MLQDYKIKQLLRKSYFEYDFDQNSDELSKNQLNAYDKLNRDNLDEQLSSDETLRELGYYDSTDNRSCCRRKRE